MTPSPPEDSDSKGVANAKVGKKTSIGSPVNLDPKWRPSPKSATIEDIADMALWESASCSPVNDNGSFSTASSRFHLANHRRHRRACREYALERRAR
jgi:hypothetical protein